MKACATEYGLKKEGDTWTQGGLVVTCRDHFVESVDCTTLCSNQTDSLECELCRSIGKRNLIGQLINLIINFLFLENTNSLHSCGQRNATFHQSDDCISIRPVAIATNNCPQRCINNNKNNNNNVLCCQPIIREKLIRHSCGNHEKKLVPVPIVTRCMCHKCED